MNFKLLALFAFATAAIAAPASEDVQPINADAGPVSFINPGSRVNTEARGEPEYYKEPAKVDYSQLEYYEERPKDVYSKPKYYEELKSTGPGGKCKNFQLCCDTLYKVNQVDLGLGEVVSPKGPLLESQNNINPAIVSASGCKLITGPINSCSSQPVCCAEASLGTGVASGCELVTATIE